jgi:hypothetical protein
VENIATAKHLIDSFINSIFTKIIYHAMKQLVTTLSIISFFNSLAQPNVNVQPDATKENKIAKWQMGFGLGTNSIDGDVDSKYLFRPIVNKLHTTHIMAYINKTNLKKYGYLSLGIVKGIASGNNWKTSDAYIGHVGNPYHDGFKADNGTIISAGYTSSVPTNVIYAYKTNFTQLAINQHVSTNRKKAYSIFINVGIGLILFKTNNDAYGNNGAKYDFKVITDSHQNFSAQNPSGTPASNRRHFQKLFNSVADGIYESDAESKNPGGVSSNVFLNIGGGVQYAISKQFKMQLHMNHAMTRTDLLDGQQWQEPVGFGPSALSTKLDRLNTYTLGLVYNLK